MYKVILIDDEKSVKQTLRCIFESEYPLFQVVGEASDGQEGLELIRSTDPDLVITDIRMPVMSGLQLAEVLSRQANRPEIIFISGYDTFDYAKQALRFGVNDYLVKPISSVEVGEMLQSLTAKFESEQRKLQESLDWLRFSKSHIKQLAQSIWMLKETEAFAELAHIHEQFLSAAFAEFQYKDMVSRLFFALELEMIELKCGLLPADSCVPVEAFHHPDTALHAMQAQLQQYMVEIRVMRKWSTYKPIMKAVEYIQDHYGDENLSLSEVARSVDMSPSYFSKCFIDDMGVSFTAFLIKLRLHKAMELLNATHLKVYEISRSVGYSNYDHFAKAFKKHLGVSPSEYRNCILPGGG